MQVKDAVLDSPVFGAVYRTGMTLRAVWHARRGRDWNAISARLRALRSAPGQEHSAATMARVRRWLDRHARDERGELKAVASNGWLQVFLQTEEAERLRAHFATVPLHHRLRLREPNDENPRRQGNLIVLKRHDPATGEKGVILLKYHETLRRFPAMYELPSIASRYAIILEPSSWGYEDPTFFLYAASDVDVIVQSPWRRDYQFIRELRANMHAVRTGAGDWVDPAIFSSDVPRGQRRFDLVMVSSWSPWKRHRDLFRAVAELKRRGVVLRMALVGYPLVWDMARIERLLVEHGLREQCTLFDSIPQREVAKVVGDAEMYVLLSRREGANKALYEALFCDTPVVVYAHHRGVNTDMVRDGVGVLYEADALGDAMMRLLANRDAYQPLAWARAHSGYQNSTAAMNAILKRMSAARGLPWTRDIVAKKNAPENTYVSDADQACMDPEYDLLEPFLR